MKGLFGGPGDPMNERELGLEKMSWTLIAVALVVLVLSRVLVFGSFQLPKFGDFFETVGMSPNNASSFAALAIFYLLAKPSRGHRDSVAVLACILEVVYLMNLQPSWGWFDRLLVFGGGIGVAALIGLSHLAALAPLPVDRRRARVYLRLGLILLLYPMVSGAMIGSLSYLTPQVFDAYAYNLEGSLGFFPSFEAAHWQATHPLWARAFYVIYARLLIWVLLAFALNQLYRSRCYSELFPAFALSGLVALCHAYALPMVGIDIFLGVPPWPFGPIPPTAELKLVAAPPNYPRTCIPSMHTCWILLSYFVVARISPRLRAFYLVLVAGTLISALGPRIGHYFLDLVAAFPFAVSWQAITANPLPATKVWRYGGFVAGQLATLGYCLTIRWHTDFWLGQPYLFWALSLGLIAGSLVFESHLARLTLAAEPQTNADDQLALTS